MSDRMPIGDMLLTPVGDWQFHLARGAAVGRRLPMGGIIRVRTYHHNEPATEPSHSAWLELACKFGRCSSSSPFDSLQLATVTGPFGGASFHRRRDYVRVWYCGRSAGIIVGAYSCGWELRIRREYRRAIAECESMMMTAIFNRPLWGGTDILTKALTDPVIEPLEIVEYDINDPKQQPPRPL